MSPERWQQIEPILEDALALPAGERAQFLQQVCNGDLSLRLDVEAFLAEKSRADEFLAEPVLALPNDLKQFAVSTQANTIAAPSSLIGQQLGSYKIISLLGKGGMGEVYLARDTKLDREVAIKLLPPILARDPEREQRFKREARLQAKLNNHQNIAIIHALEQSEDASFLVLEYVPGETLGDRLQHGALPIAEALPLFRQIAAALATAHQQGIIHRDLKPANIKITPSGQIKVLDFGLAKLLHNEAPTAEAVDSLLSTRTYWTTDRQVIIGTVPYMSPEQTYGKDLDHRTDVWAFGCVLYEALTGQRPFTGFDTFDLFNAIRTRELDWQALPAVTPPAIRKLLQQCLQKEPEQRLSSAFEAQVTIEQVAADSAPTFIALKWQRWKKQIATAAGITAVIAAGTVAVPSIQKWINPHPTATPSSIPLPLEKTLAVLPFKDAGNKTLGTGIAKSLQEIFAAIPDLRVLPLGEVLQADLSQAAPERLSKALGVTWLLNGEVERNGDMVKIKYWVQDKQATQMLSGTVEGHSNEYAKLQSEVVAKVTTALNINLPNQSLAAVFKDRTSEEKYLTAVGALQGDLTKKNIEPVIKSLKELAQTEEQSAPVQAALAQAYFQKAKLSKNASIATQAAGEAIRLAERAVKLAPNSLEVEIVRGQALLFLDEFDQAIQSFVRARGKQPSNLEAILGLAYSYEEKKQFDEAEKYYQAAVNHWPDYWGSHNELGAFFLDRGQADKALKEWEKVIERNRTGVSGYINVGNACIKLGRYAEAEDYFRQALDQMTNSNETTEEAYIGWGIARYYQGLYAAAADSFSNGLAFNDKSVLLLAGLGDAQRHQPGQEQKAMDPYQKAIVLFQQHQLGPIGLAHLAELFAKRSQLYSDNEPRKTADKHESLRLIGVAEKRDAQNATVLGSAALVYYLNGDEERALDYIEKALQKGYSLTDLEHEPDFQTLRLNPRFEEQVRPFRKSP